MKLFSALVFLFTTIPVHAQKFDLDALAKLKTAALVVKAESTVSCGDGSSDSCLRNDSDIAAQVRKIVDGSDVCQRFTQVEATKADAIIQFKIQNAKTASGTLYLEVRDADTNKVLFWERRDAVLLENDVVRMVSHLLKVCEEAKTKPPVKKKAPNH